MPRRRLLQMVVCVSAPADMPKPAALSVVRSALRNSDPGELGLFTVSPIPRDRLIKKRQPPTRNETPPMLKLMGVT